jgi:hypothetical protein
LTKFYKIFHGNLAFSAVEESALPEVIDKCYLPLLHFIQQSKTPIGIELSGYSLEKIKHYRPQWISQFKALHQQGLVELIGSGYMQIIGPLVPYQVNLQNQVIGLTVYQEILDITPNIAFVNEQALSKSMIDIYAEAGYQGLVMEWNNAFSIHPDWQKNYAHSPVIAQGEKQQLPLLWTDSILFQHYQRTIHNQLDIDTYLSYLSHYIKQGYQALPIYSSDLEIFNYRPGRFETEAIILNDEWKMVKNTTKAIKQLGKFLLPSDILNQQLNKQKNLILTTSCTPILVKKQQKYALSRWAACGRGATHINTLCYRLYNEIKEQHRDSKWKKLLQYWGSDYRTHITSTKWADALDYLKAYKLPKFQTITNSKPLKNFKLIEKRNSIHIERDSTKIVLLTNKGLCLESVDIAGKQLPIGTIRHGELDFIHHGADYYTGTTVIDSAEHGRVSDLATIESYLCKESGNKLTIQATIALKDIGFIYKQWSLDLNKKQLTFQAKISLNKCIKGSIRSGAITLKTRPKKHPFWYQTHNGGKTLERYIIDEHCTINHSQPQSLLQSSKAGLGVSEGYLAFGEKENQLLSIQVDKAKCAPFVMLQNSIDNNLFLTRIFFSLQELDDTLKETNQKQFLLTYTLSLK